MPGAASIPYSRFTVRVLVIDDSAPVRARLVSLLGIELPEALIHATSSGEAALDFVRSHSIDVIVLDLHLPGREGLDLLGALKSVDHSPRVLVLTADATEQHRRACLALGAEAFLDKATEFDRVAALIVSDPKPARV
jgi:DNA-binding NarL/FixJ family response regulator